MDNTERSADVVLPSEGGRVADASADTMRRAFDAGLIRGFRVGKMRFLERASVEAFAREREAKRSGRAR